MPRRMIPAAETEAALENKTKRPSQLSNASRVRERQWDCGGSVSGL